MSAEKGYNCSMKAKRLAATLVAVTFAAGPAAVAHADPFEQFQSPSGDVTCVMAAFGGDAPRASCGVAEPSYVMPPRPRSCVGAFGDQIDLVQGSPPAMVCHTDTTRGIGLPTLPVGETRSVAALSCTSEAAAITCTDSSTGHFFRISRTSYTTK